MTKKRRRRRDFEDIKVLVPYVRQSRARINENAETALSLEAQEQQIREWGLRNGYTVEPAVRDHDEDSETDERDGIAELYARIRPGVTVGVELWDRLGRGWILGAINSQVEKRGGRTHSTTQGGDPLTREMHGVMGGQYLDMLSDRLHSVTASRVQRGIHVGHTPYGYDRPGRLDYTDKHGTAKTRHTGPLEPFEAHARHVRRIYAWWIGGQSLRWISLQLTAEGILSPSGNPWGPNTIAWMLRNPVYAGGVRMKDTIVWAAQHDPLIARETWDAAQLRFERAASVHHKDDPHWADGLILHGCGGRMLLNMIGRPGGTRYASYRCTNSKRPGPHLCQHPRQHIGAPLIDATVRQCLTLDLRARVPVDQAIARAWAEAGGDAVVAERTRLEDARTEQVRQRIRARTVLITMDNDVGAWDEVRVAYDRAIAAIDREIALLPAPPDEALVQEQSKRLTSIARSIGRSSDARLRELVTLLGVIVVCGEGVSVRYYPEYRAHFTPHTVMPRRCFA